MLSIKDQRPLVILFKSWVKYFGVFIFSSFQGKVLDHGKIHSTKPSRYTHSENYRKSCTGTTTDMKIVLLGTNNCGKTPLLERYINRRFITPLVTTGASFSVKEIDVEGRTLTLAIYDTAGHESYNSITFLPWCPSCGRVLWLDWSLQFWPGKVLGNRCADKFKALPYILVWNKKGLSWSSWEK